MVKQRHNSGFAAQPILNTNSEGAFMKKFEIHIPDSAINDLHQRLDAARLIADPHNSSWEEGVPGDARDKVLFYWRHEYNWRKEEAKLNELPQYMEEVPQGETLHFIYKKGGKNALPLLLCHGWPGSFVEMQRVIPLLTTPDETGLSFDVVIPSMPGYGFSSYHAHGPINLCTIGDMYHSLMMQLGYSKYYVQGGDWGAHVAIWMARNYPDSVLGYHINFIPGSYTPQISTQPMSEEEMTFLQKKATWYADGGGYDLIQITRPLTIATALNDSPAGLCMWLFEKFHDWSDWENSFTDPKGGLTMDNILTDISVYWFTQSIYSACRLYREAEKKKLVFYQNERIDAPMGFTAYPAEFFEPPRSWLERVLNVRYWGVSPAGGHFAAMEQPEIFNKELRAFICAIM